MRGASQIETLHRLLSLTTTLLSELFYYIAADGITHTIAGFDASDSQGDPASVPRDANDHPVRNRFSAASSLLWCLLAPEAPRPSTVHKIDVLFDKKEGDSSPLPGACSVAAQACAMSLLLHVPFERWPEYSEKETEECVVDSYGRIHARDNKTTLEASVFDLPSDRIIDIGSALSKFVAVVAKKRADIIVRSIKLRGSVTFIDSMRLTAEISVLPILHQYTREAGDLSLQLGAEVASACRHGGSERCGLLARDIWQPLIRRRAAICMTGSVRSIDSTYPHNQMFMQ